MHSDSDDDNDLSDSDDSMDYVADDDGIDEGAEVVEERWRSSLPRIRENDPLTTKLVAWGGGDIINMSDEDWEQLGRDIANNTHLTHFNLSYGCLNDQRMSFLFRGLTKSSSITHMYLHQNADDSVVGVRSMVPFLQNANKLHKLTLSNNEIQSGGFNVLFQALSNSPIEMLLVSYCGIESVEIDSNHIPKELKLLHLNGNSINADGCRGLAKLLQNTNSLNCLKLNDNNIQSAGFNTLFRALRDIPVKTLRCNTCGIQSIEIDSEHIPSNLKRLSLSENNIGADGCRELAKLLQGGDTTLESLYLQRSKIDDEDVAILVDALRSNTSLKELHLDGNAGISNRGQIKLLKLVNDVSSIKATLQSNHTLINVSVGHVYGQIQMHIYNATNISDEGSPETAGREKVIKIQLDSEIRAELAKMQGVNHSLYSEIDPLHLPEVLELVARHHGQEDLYLALKASIAGLKSTVNRKECIRQRMAYHEEKLKELSTELATIEAAEGVVGDGGGRKKRLRAC